MDLDFLIPFAFIAFALFLKIVQIKAKNEAARKKQQSRQQQMHQPEVEEMLEEKTRKEHGKRHRRPQTFQELLEELTGQKQKPGQYKSAPKPTQVISDNYDEGAEHHVTLHKQEETEKPTEWKGMENLTEAQKLLVYSEIIKPKFQEEE